MVGNQPMVGNRKTVDRRLGLLVPSSNTVAELDFVRGVPSSVTVHTARAHLPEVTRSAEERMLRDFLPQAAEDLASTHPHVVVFSCTSAAAILGPEEEDQLVSRLEHQVGTTVISTNAAVYESIASHDPEQVAILTPYVEELNDAIASSLTERGIQVITIVGMGLSDNLEISRVAPTVIRDYAMERLDQEEFDLLFVSCTNFRALDALPLLTAAFEKPVVTSNSAALEAALQFLSEER